MKTTCSTTILTLLLVARALAAQPDPESVALFRDHGLRAGSPVEALPQNALIHVQINQPQRILENVERWIVSTVPEKLLPPQLQPLFASEHPVLTLLGMQSIQAPLTAEQIAEKMGLATDQPASLTLYPGLPQRSFLVTLPIKNHVAFEAFCRGALNPKKIEAATVSDKTFVRLELNHPQIREVYFACSADRAFITGEPSLLLLLYADNSFPRLKDDAHFADVLKKASGEDVWLTFDPSFLKPVLPQIQFFEYLPLQMLAQHRGQLLGKIPSLQRTIIEQRLRLQFGIRNLEEFADYAECVLGATYEELFEFVLTNLKSFNGVTLALKLDPVFPQWSAYLHSSQYHAGDGTQPIPLDVVRTALSRIPGQHRSVTVRGREPKVEPSVHLTSWLKRVRRGFEAKHLNLAFVEILEKLHRETVRPQPIGAQVPWMITTRTVVNPAPSLREAEALRPYFRDLLSTLSYPSTRTVSIVPGRLDRLLENSFRAEQDALTRNRDLIKKKFDRDRVMPEFLDTAYRLIRRAREHDVQELTWETAFVTRAGLFGFNQHELVSRRTYFTRAIDDYTVFHQASKDARWISELQLRTEPRISPGLSKLLDRVPAGANYFSVYRPLAGLPDVMNWAQGLEDLAHRDAETYLNKARSIANETPDRDELVRKLEALKFSPVVSSVNRDPESGEVYALLPGNLVFPRSKIAPAVQKLFAEFNRHADDVGGFLVYTRRSVGAAEGAIVHNAEGLSKLVKSVGNAFQEQYLSEPGKIAELQQLLVSDRDRNPKRISEVLVRNPAWEFLSHIKIQGPTSKPRPQTDATPIHPIAPRDPQTPENLIDLSAHYNASPNDSWHSGATPGNDLASLAQGIQEFAGVKFDVRGIVQLSGQDAAQQLSVRFPKNAAGIKIGQTCAQLHFLHGAGWQSPDGTKISSYVVRYEDGTTEEIPIEYGTHVRDWWTPADKTSVSGSEVAWKGSNAASSRANLTLQLYKTTWKNPHPDKTITGLDYVSTMSHSAPFLIAITAEPRS